ncbi:MAG: hypothetical protein ABJO91_15370 [Ekhidna sp.]
MKKFEKKDKSFLHFVFRNKFTEDMSTEATQVWSNFCDLNSTKKFIHIWDCQSMGGFDNSAKNKWISHLNKYKNQTEKIILISDNIIIRGAGRIMSKISDHHLSVYRTFEEMTLKEM